MIRYIAQDIHRPDRDSDRITSDGYSGRQAWDAFVNYNWDCGQILAVEFCNCTSQLPKLVTTESATWRAVQRGRMILSAGNHDLALVPKEQETPLGYSHDTIHSVTVRGKRYAVLHGREFDPFWRDDPRHPRWTHIRQAFGQDIIERGVQAEDLVSPRVDEYLVWALRGVRGIVAPKGERLDAERYARAAARWACENGYDGVVLGHTHRPWRQMVKIGERLIDVVVLGAWVPEGKWPGHLDCHVFDVTDGGVYRWCMDPMTDHHWHLTKVSEIGQEVTT